MHMSCFSSSIPEPLGNYLRRYAFFGLADLPLGKTGEIAGSILVSGNRPSRWPVSFPSSHLLYFGCADWFRLSILRRVPAMCIRSGVSVAAADAVWKESSSGVPRIALEMVCFMQHRFKDIFFYGAFKLFLRTFCLR
jgi:hypothetical protein